METVLWLDDGLKITFMVMALILSFKNLKNVFHRILLFVKWPQ